MSIVDRLSNEELAEAATLYIEKVLEHAVLVVEKKTIALRVECVKSHYNDSYTIRHQIVFGDYPKTEQFENENMFESVGIIAARLVESEQSAPRERTLLLTQVKGANDDVPF